MVRLAVSTTFVLGLAIFTQAVSVEAAMSRSQARCVRETNRAYQKLAAVYGAEYARCVKAVGAPGAGTLGVCLANADQSAKVLKAKERVQKIEATRCSDTPPYGFSSSATVIQAAADQERDILERVFGPDLEAAILPDKASCQARALQFVQQCRDTTLAGFNQCKFQTVQEAEAQGPLLPGQDLARACMTEGNFREVRLTGEPRLFKQRCRNGIGKTLEVCQVATVAQLAALFPGDCANPPGGAWGFCMKELVPCAVCRALDVADALGLDGLEYDQCDVADDGQLNGSCS